MNKPKSKASEKQAQHSPIPWKVFADGKTIAIFRGDSVKEIIGWTGFDSSDFPEQNLANAQLIVQAVNSHEVAREMMEFIANTKPQVLQDGSVLVSEQFWLFLESLARKFQEIDREQGESK